MLTPLWFLTYILVIAKITGHIDFAWWLVLLPAAFSMVISAVLFAMTV